METTNQTLEVKKEMMEESLSGSHYNVAPPYFRETTKERFCRVFFTYCLKGQTSKQIHRYSNGKELKKPIFDIRLWELAYYTDSMGVAMQRDGDEIKYYIFGSEEQWTKFSNGMAAQFAGDNS